MYAQVMLRQLVFGFCAEAMSADHAIEIVFGLFTPVVYHIAKNVSRIQIIVHFTLIHEILALCMDVSALFIVSRFCVTRRQVKMA